MMQKKPHPHPNHSGDMPWLNPSKLPTKPAAGSIKHAVDEISAILKGLPSKADRHQAVGLVLARLVESEHIRLNDIWQTAMQEANRYNFID